MLPKDQPVIPVVEADFSSKLKNIMPIFGITLVGFLLYLLMREI